jgi:hypothetical protein
LFRVQSGLDLAVRSIFGVAEEKHEYAVFRMCS